MARWFNIGGPCNPAQNYMLPATERLPDVVSLIRKGQYFVVHAPRQCGKTTAFQALADEINAKGEMVAHYCSVEAVQEFRDPKTSMAEIAQQICLNLDLYAELFGADTKDAVLEVIARSSDTAVVTNTLKAISERLKKPLIVFFDEVDCLSDGTLVSFLHQLRNGRIACKTPNSFPVSIALIGLRNIRDYKMRFRPEGQSTGEASPFNVITETMTLRSFTESEMRELYQQHTDATGQVFEEEASRLVWEYSQGQPYLINGGGQIIREMAPGSGRLDLGVKYRKAVYAVEVKTVANYAKSHDKAHQQILRYMDSLGVAEGWHVVADTDFTKPWDDKISTMDISEDSKTIHVVRC